MKREVESEGRLIGDFGIVSILRRPMLKHDAGRILHNERYSPIRDDEKLISAQLNPFCPKPYQSTN